VRNARAILPATGDEARRIDVGRLGGGRIWINQFCVGAIQQREAELVSGGVIALADDLPTVVNPKCLRLVCTGVVDGSELIRKIEHKTVSVPIRQLVIAHQLVGIVNAVESGEGRSRIIDSVESAIGQASNTLGDAARVGVVTNDDASFVDANRICRTGPGMVERREAE